jgi:hypothetical protein
VRIYFYSHRKQQKRGEISKVLITLILIKFIRPENGPNCAPDLKINTAHSIPVAIMKLKFFSFIPHAHKWHNIRISRKGAISPTGRAYFSTHVEAQCKGCGKRLHKIYYRDISDAQAIRWLG